jgi:uncharacterized protein DUF222/HNH endonuclease
MSTTSSRDSERLFTEALAVLANSGGSSEEQLLSALKAAHSLKRLLERVEVEAVAELGRRGTFARYGNRKPETALRDLTGVEYGPAVQLVSAAQAVAGQVDAQGESVPPVLPATAAGFAAGAFGVQQVAVAAGLMGSPVAQRLTAEARVEVEAEIARLASECGPRKLRALGVEVIARADRDGSDEEAEPQVNELRIIPFPGGGGKIKATFTDPVRFNQVLAVIDAKSAPLTKDDTRTTPERQADALVDVCGFVAEHGDGKVLPDGVARRPQVALIAQVTDLENRVSAGCLTFGGIASAAELRRICCDAAVIPVVMNGDSQPLDVGARQRTIPPAIRWAVEARDRGCAHPGCDRPPSWSEVHHIKHWADGGPTAVGNLVMLCKVHHRGVHEGDWIIRMGSDGLPEFIPPEWVDSTRTPRRNPRANLVGVR